MKIAVSNQKGGSGKTTTTLNLAGAMNAQGNDVAVVDLDPQGHATEGLGASDAYEVSGASLLDVLAEIDGDTTLNDLSINHEEMTLIPSHESMINAEDRLSGAMKREERLDMALDEFADEYDHVLIDCPPNLGILTDNAIVAAPNVVIPAQTRSTSKRAIKLLFKQLGSIETAFDEEITELAAVANEVRQDNESDEMLKWLKEVFEDKENIPVYEIRKRVALQRAYNRGVSIFEHTEDCDMQAEYKRLAIHIEEVANE